MVVQETLLKILACPVDKGRLMYFANEDLLRQLLLNVIQNGVQHASPDGRVDIAVRAEGDRLELRVTNDGGAIPAADWARIFDRFVQLDPSRRAAGTGLGLPIAKWIAEAHHGRLILERSDSNGSTFSALLPAQVSVPSPAAPLTR